MCVGFILLARDLIRSGGEGLNVQAFFVGSFFRELGGQATEKSNHCFLGLKMDGGVRVGAELVTPRMSLRDFRTRCTAPRSDYVMPLTIRDQELFLARNFGADETPSSSTNHGDAQNVFHLSILGFGEWTGSPSAHLREADKSAMQDFDRRSKWVKLE